MRVKEVMESLVFANANANIACKENRIRIRVDM